MERYFATGRSPQRAVVPMEEEEEEEEEEEVIISNLIKLSFHKQYKEKLYVCYGKTNCNGYV